MKENEVLLHDGTPIRKNDPDLTQCRVTGVNIRKSRSIKVLSEITVCSIRGLTGISNSYYVREEEYTRNFGDLYFLLDTASGMTYVIDHNIRVNPGSTGGLHSNPRKRSSYLDMPSRPKEEPANKFKPFNNMVSAFDDYDNSLISDEDKKALLERDYQFGVRTLTNKIFEGLEYSYGVELETSSGRVDKIDYQGLNLKCEFDGSLRETPDQRKEDVLGGEYITGVLRGDAGMFQLQNICNVLSKKCTINDKCGVHVHIGGVPFTKENIVYMYILGVQLQDEIFELLPKSRKKNSYCRYIKDLKLDTKALNNAKTPLMYGIIIDEYFNKIFKEVSHGKSPDKKCNKLANHPMGSKCGYDKNTQRYCWLNFVTAMFNTKGSSKAMTLEFRPHSATLSYEKVKNWVRLCAAFVNFAENHQTSIKRGYWINKCGDELPVDLSTIVKAAYSKTNGLLLEYIEERKAKFKYDTGDKELTEYDKTENVNNSLNKIQCV